MVRATLTEQEIRRVVGLPGVGNRAVDGVAALDAVEDRCLCFLNKTATMEIRESLAAHRGCIVLAPKGSALMGEWGDCLLLEAVDPRTAIARVLGFIRDEQRQQPWVTDRKIAPGAVISPMAVVEGNVEIGEGTVVEPFCTVGPDVRIGRGTILRAGARILPRVSIGDHTIIGHNAVIGSMGFGFVRDEAGNKSRIPHLGGIVIGSHVEIGTVTSIQYGTISPTVIEDHVKIDDDVAIGHNAHIARGASLVGGTIIGGSTMIGADAWIGMNATIRNGRQIGPRSLVGMDASVQKDVPAKGVARGARADVRKRTDSDPTSIGFKDR